MMRPLCSLTASILFMTSAMAWSSSPQVQSPLPALSIADRGELVLDQDDFDYRPWSSEQQPGKVHVLQYFAGTMGDSKTFEPFTDLLQQELELGSYHVTTIINLDAATWGTTGFVVGEVKSSKRKFPGSTMVLDEDGLGASHWQLGDKGAGLVIVDPQGVVQFFTREALSEQQMRDSLELVRSYIEG